MLNNNLKKIEEANTFSTSKKKIKEYLLKNPDADLIQLGIGDVSCPIIEPIREAMKKAVDDLGSMKTFQGYGLYYGLDELRKTILENEYKKYNFTFDEIYIGDGTKSDVGNVLELFDHNSKVLVGDPAYPIYQNSVHATSHNLYLGETDDNFKTIVPKEKYDIVMLCSPTNPVGNAYTIAELTKWVEYANKNNAIIFYDNVYEAFIESKDVPISIYEIENAKKCAIEFRSFSKKASFSSMRCSYFVIPEDIEDGINTLWKERTINRFNGSNYVSQKGAVAFYTKESQELIAKNIQTYKENTRYLKDELTKLGFDVVGGVDSPYLWVKTKDNMTSWEAFKVFLEDMNIVVVPGEIFGKNGLHRLRISGLGNINDSRRAIDRIRSYYEKNI